MIGQLHNLRPHGGCYVSEELPTVRMFPEDYHAHMAVCVSFVATEAEARREEVCRLVWPNS
jgi:hypothetical protein